MGKDLSLCWRTSLYINCDMWEIFYMEMQLFFNLFTIYIRYRRSFWFTDSLNQVPYTLYDDTFIQARLNQWNDLLFIYRHILKILLMLEALVFVVFIENYTKCSNLMTNIYFHYFFHLH